MRFTLYLCMFLLIFCSLSFWGCRNEASASLEAAEIQSLTAENKIPNDISKKLEELIVRLIQFERLAPLDEYLEENFLNELSSLCNQEEGETLVQLVENISENFDQLESDLNQEGFSCGSAKWVEELDELLYSLRKRYDNDILQ